METNIVLKTFLVSESKLIVVQTVASCSRNDRRVVSILMGIFGETWEFVGRDEHEGNILVFVPALRDAKTDFVRIEPPSLGMHTLFDDWLPWFADSRHPGKRVAIF